MLRWSHGKQQQHLTYINRRALELAETATKKQTLLKPLTPRGNASPTKSPAKGYKVPRPLPKVGQVDLPQIMRVINQEWEKIAHYYLCLNRQNFHKDAF